ncbi:MAG: hypothetical protein FWF06_04385 [Symbiobacteriaceae bacterium]|nr:hypothetical protein [Symbiobacteriaceae bacterium]
MPTNLRQEMAAGCRRYGEWRWRQSAAATRKGDGGKPLALAMVGWHPNEYL